MRLVISLYLACLVGIADPAAAQPPTVQPVIPPPILPQHVVDPAKEMAAAGIKRPPKAKQSAQSYFLAGDYPQSALANRQEGRVRVTLDVDSDGHVTWCTIKASSGAGALDGATCRILRTRAQFTPAMDVGGKPAAWKIDQDVEWKLPG